MDSDCSVDNDFETKCEISTKLENECNEPTVKSPKTTIDDSYDSSDETPLISPAVCSSDIKEIEAELSKSDNEEEEKCSNPSSESDEESHEIAEVVGNIVPNGDSNNKKTGPSTPPENNGECAKQRFSGHSEDLSDVSDLDSNDGHESLGVLSDDGSVKKGQSFEDVRKEETVTVVQRKDTAEPVEEVEQLDFEAEEQQEKEDREEGECEGKEEKSDDEGELKGDELEEGEISDEDEHRPEETEPRPVCRFYNRGQCTWGSNCRFLHPGVTDKGNYTMFDMVRPLVPVNGPPMYGPPMEYRVPYEKPVPNIPVAYQAPRKEKTPALESAWERGLRQAKEMMRKSSKRKETDMDFEEKKMNLSLGQEELDKENDYYTRPASPINKDDERWAYGEDGKYREGSVALEHYEEVGESPYYHHSRGGDYWRRVHYEPGDSRALRVEAEYGSSKYHSQQRRTPPPEFYKYDKKSSRQKSSHATREVIEERTDKHWRDERYSEVSGGGHRSRGDEWADPWMRSKSPTLRKSGGKWPSRRRSSSTRSSYSSSSSSRSSSQSSCSSRSRDSRSRSKSKSRSLSRSLSRSPSRFMKRKTKKLTITTRIGNSSVSPPMRSSTSPRRVTKTSGENRAFAKTRPLTASLIQSEKKAASERALLMNPPAPTPKKPKEVRPPSPGMMRKSAQNPPAPQPPPHTTGSTRVANLLQSSLEHPKTTSISALLSNKTDDRSRSKSSHSSSSDSSGSSSDSSDSSSSSSSSSREASPRAVRAPKYPFEEKDRPTLKTPFKIAPMDALKLSGQKQQIKLTLKTSNNTEIRRRNDPALPELPELNLVRRAREASPVSGAKRKRDDTSPTPEYTIAAKMAALSKGTAKKATSRREELLKQLKAVEDAIARKRSKI